MVCSSCKMKVRSGSKFCIHCGTQVTKAEKNSMEIQKRTISVSTPKDRIDNQLVKYGKARIMGWFLLTNAAIIVSMVVISGGSLTPFIPFFLTIGGVLPFFGLIFSRHFAKKAHKIKVIGNDEPNFQEIQNLVFELANKAGIKEMPEVGIYYDSNPNAFATGWRKNKALVAFSTGLIDMLTIKELEAVAAHEISHIVNGDMIIMTIIQCVINSLVMVITLPFSVFKGLAFFSDEVGVFTYWMISLVKTVVASVLMFLGSIVVKFFSRSREFKADALACKLVNGDNMISALSKLENIEIRKENKKLQAYASLKIVSPSAFFDVFSTHPSIERRIKRLTELNS